MTTFHYPNPERVSAQPSEQTPEQTPAQSPEQGLAHNSPLTGIDPEVLRALANVAQGPSQADNLLQGENITSNEEQLTQAKADLEAFANQLYPDTYPNNTQPRQDFIAGFRIETQDDQAVIIPIDPNTNQPIENFKLSISGRGLTGELLLPHQMQISVLHCPDNQLTSLPNQLPDSLTILDCCNNQLTSLPDPLPAGLTVIW
jgi:Leucine-rich repeat (LRR) protein